MASQIERILILAKTYPSPSKQHIETSCIAGINEHGVMRRLYPVPFRLIEEGQQFKKWQWIDVRIEKATKDHRSESYKIYIDTIVCGEKIDTKKEWLYRREWLSKIPSFENFEELEANRLSKRISLALLQPKELIELEIHPARNPEWTDEEKEKLTQEQMQGNLFSESDAKQQINELRKVPFDFYYRYLCETPDGNKEFKHKIVDWEAGALFWKCCSSHGARWEIPFRHKLKDDFSGKDLMFLMGNQHRFQDQWLIISLIYPPRPSQVNTAQGSLF
ncbi:MAG: hypothetical protein K2P74_01595 [Nitrosomonas sp.]|nr:hypothetical protein [Nitrosomonas sp.]